MSSIKPPPGMAECPKCDMGYDGFDEDGRPYACYFCGTSGWVPAGVIEEYEREQAEYLAASPAPAPSPAYAKPAPSAADVWEDLPF